MVGLVFITYSAKIIASVFILISDLIRLFQYVWRFTKTKRKKELPKEKQNIEIVNNLCDILDLRLGRTPASRKLITFVKLTLLLKYKLIIISRDSISMLICF